MSLEPTDPRNPAWWPAWPWSRSGRYAEQDAFVAERGYGLVYADFWDEPHRPPARAPHDATTEQADYVVGFTGTRDGMTGPQSDTVAVLLSDPWIDWVHHGDCVGADAEFHQAARQQGLWICVHPPDDTRLRAFCKGDWVLPPLPYLTRNRAIVGASDILIAAPKTVHGEQERGGTWYTVRYARSVGRTIVVVWPNGATKRIRPRVRP